MSPAELKTELKIIIECLDAWSVMDLIAKAIETAGSQEALAIEWGISELYLSDILRGRREPGNKILKNMGLVKVLVYRKKAEG